MTKRETLDLRRIAAHSRDVRELAKALESNPGAVSSAWRNQFVASGCKADIRTYPARDASSTSDDGSQT